MLTIAILWCSASILSLALFGLTEASEEEHGAAPEHDATPRGAEAAHPTIG